MRGGVPRNAPVRRHDVEVTENTEALEFTFLPSEEMPTSTFPDSRPRIGIGRASGRGTDGGGSAVVWAAPTALPLLVRVWILVARLTFIF